MKRRAFIQAGAALGIGAVFTQSSQAQALKVRKTNPQVMDTRGDVAANAGLPINSKNQGTHYRPKYRMGLGGLAAGNGFNTISNDEEILKMLHAAWDSGVRHYDTSPFYGLSLSERRFGDLLRNKKREDYVLSSKVGRILTPSAEPLPKKWHWAKPSPFHYHYDYSAAGTRRSIEDSLHRIGVSSLDIVYIHDLSPQNSDMGENWTQYVDEALKGAIPELTKMRDEGIIKGWGFGINTPDILYNYLDQMDPDICLLALQYSILDHQQALDKTFPLLDERDISVVVGAPLNGGFLAGRNRFNYSSYIPQEMQDKYTKISAIAQQHGIDIKTAALQFAAAPSTVSAIIPGARTSEQLDENVESMKIKIPAEFWSKLKSEKLIMSDAPTPS
ncbi:aldo/keto reductase [Coraliomargarita algicola]|uniref:Aldo/keto reductase n=1 Tax=Coraliomargarita algicola TaxID=3092156 RepID=A0ABZ0RHX5_9BACT|nr:aldo/keto reductase [Coraliomargarita sp. J2-16]WPJ94615.1 aldo/keto reductase [Coraliomargarita sp. J2-16]